MTTDIQIAIDDLQGLAHAELVARYEDVTGRKPRTRSKPWLIKRLAYEIQARALGGLPGAARRRLRELAQDVDLTDEREHAPTSRASRGLKPGTVLRRDWKGKQIVVRVTDERRFEHEGEVFRSLSAVAKAVTGAKWNGRLFFNLTSRRSS